MIQKFDTGSLRMIRSSMLIFGMVVGVSVSAHAALVHEPVELMDKASADGSFVIAQTAGMDRRQDRRDTRQDCRQKNGAVGADKRHCKQQGR